MIHHFPHEAAFLPRTKLSYVNLPGILSDGKRDRAARVSGFVCIQLGERCYLIFLRNGEPFHSARLQAQEGRGAAALSEVLRIAATECERGEAGQIGYFGAPEAQLQAMLATLVQEPVEWAASVESTRPELLFPQLRQRQFTGVLELCAAGRHHYMIFEEGVFRSGYFTDRDGGVPVPDFVRSVFGAAGGAPRVIPYPALGTLPVQAGPGLVDLYRRMIGGILRELSVALGRDAAMAMVRGAQAEVGGRFPAARAFHLTDEGRVAGDPVASPEGLTEAVAGWLTATLIAGSRHDGVDPAAMVERVARDSRFVLQEQGFFDRLPWAVSL
jgi:hypothetical protein